MGADAIKALIARIDFDEEEIKLREAIDPTDGRKPLSVQRKQAIKRLKIVTAFNRRRRPRPATNDPRDDPRGRAGDPAGAAPDGPARRWPLRRPTSTTCTARHQPQQPPQAAAGPGRAGDHRQQREAHAAGGRRRPVRQRPPRAGTGPGNRPLKSLSDMLKGKQGRFRQNLLGKRRLLGSLGHRGRPDAAPAPVRSAQADGAGAVQALRHEAPGGPGAGPGTSSRPSGWWSAAVRRSGTCWRRSSRSTRSS